MSLEKRKLSPLIITGLSFLGAVALIGIVFIAVRLAQKSNGTGSGDESGNNDRNLPSGIKLNPLITELKDLFSTLGDKFEVDTVNEINKIIGEINTNKGRATDDFSADVEFVDSLEEETEWAYLNAIESLIVEDDADKLNAALECYSNVTINNDLKGKSVSSLQDHFVDMHKRLFFASDVLVTQIFKGEELKKISLTEKLEKYFVGSQKKTAKRILQALWETIQTILIQSTKDTKNLRIRLCLNRIQRFNNYPAIKGANKLGIPNTANGLVKYYDENVGKVKPRRKSWIPIIPEEYALTYQQLTLSPVILNVVKGQPLLAGIRPLNESDASCIFRGAWEATRRLLQNIPGDDEFMSRLVINRIIKFNAHPELVNACPSNLAYLYALESVEAVKQYHSANKKPPTPHLAGERGPPNSETFDAIKNYFAELKKNALSEETVNQLKENLKSKIESVVNYYSDLDIEIFPEEIEAVLEEDYKKQLGS